MIIDCIDTPSGTKNCWRYPFQDGAGEGRRGDAGAVFLTLAVYINSLEPSDKF